MTKLLWLPMLLLILPRTEDVDTASLHGRVTGENKIAIAGAKVSARNIFSGKVAAVSSDAHGRYELTGLQQGRYSAFATAEGYGCVWAFNVLLYRGESTRLDFALAGPQKKGSPPGCT